LDRDIYLAYESNYENSGDENTCDKSYYWDDQGSIGCSHNCGAPSTTTTTLGSDEISIIECTSDWENWLCEEDEICLCEISGHCEEGDLYVYEQDSGDILCIFNIEDQFAEIQWDYCGNPVGWVEVEAECGGKESETREIYISSLITTSTSTFTTTTTPVCDYDCQSICENDRNPPFCYIKISHGTFGCPEGMTCCESILVDCPVPKQGEVIQNDKICPYECCIDMPGYEYKRCSYGYKCCDHLCKRTCDESPGREISTQLLFWIILSLGIPITAFIIFSIKTRKMNLPEY
jgi:hypothetical protein